MKVLICDDEPLARERLKRFIERIEGYEVVGEAENGIEAPVLTEKLEPDILIIDIQMPSINGLEAAKHISQFKQPPAIIFCTAYENYAVEAFQVNAIAYLLKPVKQEQLIKALQNTKRVNKAQLSLLTQDIAQHEGLECSRTHVCAKTYKGIELIPVKDIRYFKADQKYVVVKHSKGQVLVDNSLKEFEQELGQSFVRIHRNALVSINFIEGLEMVAAGHYQVRIKGIEERLQVSRRHVSGLRKLLQSL